MPLDELRGKSSGEALGAAIVEVNWVAVRVVVCANDA